MAKTIEILTFTNPSENYFEATGTVEGVSFSASTILYGKKGEKQPIFKVQEDGEHKALEGSSFDRGTRIAVARHLKLVRLGDIELNVPAVSPTKGEAVELDELSVKELKALCRDKGVTGHSARGVRKSDLVTLLQVA